MDPVRDQQLCRKLMLWAAGIMEYWVWRNAIYFYFDDPLAQDSFVIF